MERRVLSKKTKALEIIDLLVKRADGMFLWARLFTTYIASTALSVAQREDALMEVNLPDGLEQMYNNILGLILSGNRASSDLARLVFMWLLYARRELSASELEQALILCRNCPKSDSEDKFNDFESTITITCAGLVERSSLIHTSVREYFLSVDGDLPYGRNHPPSTLQRLIASRAESHFEILKCCVGYITYRLPAQPLSGNLGLDPNKKDLESAFPFVGYAATEWSSHLLPSFKWGTITLNHASLDGLVEVMSNFLHQPLVLMAWIEACYVLGQSSETKYLNQWGQEVLSNKELVKGLKLSTIATEAVQLSQDLSKMHEFWGQQLRSRPGCIWEEVTAFNPSSLLARNTGITVHSLVAGNSDDEQSAKPLVKMSRTSSDGNFVAVLGVWPSR
ncbi:hypothetical protein BDZ45DRAFT_697133 [Acephala macrosclerotiorum]|nr:hypothetical protein BDZ45DRAFT_697133 [Acephala macrosclerotiorum]